MPSRDVDLERLTFLVVEDQDYVRSLIVQLLKRLGVRRVLEQPDGKAALELLKSTSADFVLCDIKMEPVGGLEFLRQLRSGTSGVRDPNLPVVFLTSDTERGTVLAAIQSEVDGYLVKPVALVDLKAKIQTALHKRRSSAWT